MPSGGTWTPGDINDPTQRPGLYAIFKTVAADIIGVGTQGIVAMPGTADWGPLRAATTIYSEAQLAATFGPSTGAGTLYNAVKEALRGGAKEILAFRMAAAAAAKATRNLLDATAGIAITLTAKYEGARANGFTVDVATNAVDGTKKDVKISESGVLLETFSGATNAAIVAAINATDGTGSKYVTAVAGAGTFVTNVAAAAMTGGNSGLSILAADWVGFENALEPLKWDIVAANALTDAGMLATFFSWIKSLRDTGSKVMGVIGGGTAETLATAKTNASSTYNHEGVVYLWPGVVDAAGVARNGSEFTPRIAGMIAAKGISVSMTFAPVTNLTSVASTPSHAEIEAALGAGVLLITTDGKGGFRIERGITTLVTPPAGLSIVWKKIRVVRILDTLYNSINQAAQGSFIGTIPNNEDGQAAIIAAVSSFIEDLANRGLLSSDFSVKLDTANPSTGDKIFLAITIKPIDAVEYIFLTIAVST